MERNLKFLLITPSFKRPYMLRASILNSANQTHTNFHHSIVINHEEGSDYNYDLMYDDIISKFDDKLPVDPFRECYNPPPKYIINYKPNGDQQENYITAITQIIRDYPEIYNTIDYILKWDDDEVHKADFLKSINNFINNNPGYHIYSSQISNQLNNYHFYTGNSYGHLGGVPDDIDIGHPATLAFDRTAAEMILLTPEDKDYWEFRGGGFEDTAWLNYWNKHNLKFKLNKEPNLNYVWHIHGGRGPGEGNISISDWVAD